MQFSDRVFATVTLCHLNPWKKVDTARANTVMKDMIAAYENWGTASASYGFSDRLDGTRQQLATQFTALMSETLYTLSQKTGATHAYTYDDLVISCTYNANSCNITGLH